MSAQDVAVGTGVPNEEQDPERVKAIASLYELALLLEKHPELPVPFELDGSGHLSINFWDADAKTKLLAAARAIPGLLKKRVWGGSSTSYYTLDGQVGTIGLQLTAYRDAVCERVVTGTREVTKTIPDPMVTVPTVEVTETVEDVEWVCGPLLREQVTS